RLRLPRCHLRNGVPGGMDRPSQGRRADLVAARLLPGVVAVFGAGRLHQLHAGRRLRPNSRQLPAELRPPGPGQAILRSRQSLSHEPEHRPVRPERLTLVDRVTCRVRTPRRRTILSWLENAACRDFYEWT